MFSPDAPVGAALSFQNDTFPFISTTVVYRLVISSDIHGEWETRHMTSLWHSLS